MKILFDHQCFSQQRFGGVSRYHFHLLKELNKLDDTNACLSLSYTNNDYIINDDEFETKRFFPKHNFPFKRTIIDNLNRLTTNQLLKKQSFDIFHPTYYNPYFITKLKEKPFVVTVYDMIHEMFPEIINKIDKTVENKKVILTSANHIIAISQNTKNDIIRLFNIAPEKIEVVYLAASINNNMTNQEIGESLPKKYILYVGSRDFYKNFNNFLFSVEKLLRDDNELFLITAGGGIFNDDELKILKKKKLINKVIYKNADDITLATLYSNAIAFVFPTFYEGFGIPVIEAMNCDCPVIMSNISSLPEVGGDAAIYFEPSNPESIKSQIESVIYNEELRAKLINSSRIQRTKFSFTNTAIQTKLLYERILNK